MNAIKREELGLSSSYPALALFDPFKGQTTEKVFRLLEKHNIHFMLIPENCTDRLQPLDVVVNKPVKDFLKGRFQEWYANQVQQQLADGEELKLVDM